MDASLINEVTKNRNNILSMCRSLSLLSSELLEVMWKLERDVALLQDHVRLMQEAVESVREALICK